MMKKSLLFSVAFVALALVGTQSASAATALCYYSFNWPDNYHTSYSTSSFSNTDGTVVVNGWQTNDRQLAKNVYSVVKKGVFFDTYFGNSQTVAGNYPQSGTWYTATITNVPAGSEYYIKVENLIYGVNQGAGNAY